MSTILVTGGSGFIGSHLVDRLLKEGHDIISIDNLLTGQASNLGQHDANPFLSTMVHDITKPLDLKEKIDCIFHMACPASPADYMAYPIETLLAGSHGTKNMLDLAQKNKARFLLASTSEIYGDPIEHPQKETYFGNVNPVGPRSCYDEAKRFAEAITMAYRRKKDVNAVIARIFNTYGPRMRTGDGRVIPNFITQALKNRPVTIQGDGTQTRSFCYVTDMIEGLAKLAFSDIRGEAVNLGNPDERTINDLAQLIIKITSSRSVITYKDLPENDPIKRLPDITKAKKLIGWQPKTYINTGLEATIEYFRSSIAP